MNIDIKNPVLTHLLGYLTENQWKDAGASLKGASEADVMFELAQIQDEKYGTNYTEVCTDAFNQPGR